jgi:pimeloyl-ACP methyl ester carboxylesterase
VRTTSVQVDSMTLQVRRAGSADLPSIVLIHGLGVSGDYYLPYAKCLSDHFDVHILDLPGYGTTPKPPKALMIRQLSRLVSGYVVQQNVPTPILVGQSMGAQIISHVAADSPAVISGIILVAPTSNRAERTLPHQAFRLAQDTFKERLSTNLIVFSNYLKMGFFRYLATAKDMVKDNLEETLKQVTVPVLVVYGTEDPIVPKEWAERLVKAAQNGSIAKVKGAPHLIQMDEPQELATATREFARSV